MPLLNYMKSLCFLFVVFIWQTATNNLTRLVSQNCLLVTSALLLLGSVYMRKLAPARVSHWDDFLISYRVYMMTGSFHILFFKGTFHVDKIHVWFKFANITHAQPVPVYRQTDFTPKRVFFFAFTWYRCEITYRSEILVPVREPGWTHTGVTRAGMTFCVGIM